MIHRRSKIARLPRELREQVNESLDNHIEYQRILDGLAEHGHSGFEMYDLTRWKDTGYLDWLARHEHTEELETKLDWVQKLASQGTSTLQKASLSVLALKLFDTINRTDAVDICKLLDTRPEKIPGLLNSFARFCHESLQMEKFTEDLQDKAKAAEQSELVDKGAATPQSIRRLKQELRFMFRKLEEAERALDAERQSRSAIQNPKSKIENSDPPLAPTCT